MTRRHVAEVTLRHHIERAMWMRRLAPLFLTTALFGCGASAASTAQPAAPVARATPEQKREEPIKLIAPPPAYGNKIVMAANGR